MAGAERVVLALGALAEARQAAGLAQRADAVAAAGQDLVRIGLMTDIPDQPVGRRVEHVMQRDGELDHAEAGAEMAAGHGHRGDQLLSQLFGELLQLVVLKGAQILGFVDPIEQRRRTFGAHSLYPADFWEKERRIKRVMHLYRPRALLATIL